MLPEWLLLSPVATVFVLLVALSMTFLTSLTNRLLTNKKQLDTWRREVAAWNADFSKARRTNDKKLLAKVQRQQPHIMKIQSKIAWQSVKVTLIFLIPLIIIWQVLVGFYRDTTIARLPWLIAGEPLPMNIILWYLLCSITFSTLFSRLFGLGIGATD